MMGTDLLHHVPTSRDFPLPRNSHVMPWALRVDNKGHDVHGSLEFKKHHRVF